LRSSERYPPAQSRLWRDPPDPLEPFSRAVSIALQIPAAVFNQISERPTPVYASIYQTANRILDEIAFKTAIALQKDGFYYLPIPASQVLDTNNWYGAISHKAVARMAGLGRQGRNLLLITPQYGSRVRLVTVLTTAPLNIDQPVKNRCKTCTACRDACPAGAIKGIVTEDHYKNRNEALYFSRCAEKLWENSQRFLKLVFPYVESVSRYALSGKKLRDKVNRVNPHTDFTTSIETVVLWYAAIFPNEEIRSSVN